MKKLSLVLFLALTSLSLHAEDFISLGKTHGEGREFYLFKGEADGVDTLVISATKRPEDGKSVAAEYVMETFLRVLPLKFKGNEKIYFVSIWGKGAHGEQVRILDPSKDEMEVARFKSSWAVTLKVEDSKLIISGKGDSIESKEGEAPPFLEYKDLIQTWSP